MPGLYYRNLDGDVDTVQFEAEAGPVAVEILISSQLKCLVWIWGSNNNE